MNNDNDFYNRVNADRISGRQIDELIGLARGLLADEKIDQSEVEFLQKWLVTNLAISNQPLIRTLYKRLNEILRDGIVDADEASDLFDTCLCEQVLKAFSIEDMSMPVVSVGSDLPVPAYASVTQAA